MCARSSGSGRRSAMRPTGQSISGTSRAMAAATCSFISIRCGPIRKSISFGIDNYMPLSDWRDGFEHADAAEGWPAILRPGPICRPTSRAAKASTGSMPAPLIAPRRCRTPITDGSAGKPWVFRYKDLCAWWSNPHYDRPGGVERRHADGMGAGVEADLVHRAGLPPPSTGAPTSPNVFFDPKSSESFTPHFSRGWRDDRNPAGLFSRRRISGWGRRREQPDVDRLRWPDGACPRMCRPGPGTRGPIRSFPALTDVWTDGANWRLGHWLTGRLGSGGAGGARAAPLPARRAARVPHQRHRSLGARWRATPSPR